MCAIASNIYRYYSKLTTTCVDLHCSSALDLWLAMDDLQGAPVTVQLQVDVVIRPKCTLIHMQKS